MTSATGSGRLCEGWLQAIVENGSEGVALLDDRGCFLYLAPSIERLLGYPALELIGLSCVELIHPDDRWQASQILAGILLEEDRIARLEVRVRHQDGTWRWIEGTGRNRLDDPGIRALILNFQDVTACRLAEGRLRQSQDHFRRIFQACPLPIGITTAHEGRFLEVNHAFLSLTGFTHGEVLGRTATELRLWVNPADRDRLLEQMRAGQPVRQHPTRFRTKSGHCYDALVSVESFRLGDQDRWLVISTDITERKRLEQQQLRTERLENVGALAGGIAHDLNNILTPILTTGELLAERLSDSETLGLLDLLQNNARRGAQLVRQILALAHRNSGARFQVDPQPSDHAQSIARGETLNAPPAQVAGFTQGAQRGVLLVDDESGILELLRSILESLNYRVWTARDGAEALQLYQQHADAIRVVVTDLIMPQLDGMTLVARLRALRSPARIICTSGLPATQSSQPWPAADGFLPKPFSLGQFMRMLHDQMGQPAAV